jgi:uncharacterized protein (DUF1810 family)
MPLHGASSGDPHDLQRFVDAQASVFDRAFSEIRAGCKRTHWMWFIFPQIQGLGMSETSEVYSIKSVSEARAYLDHPLLGPRLVQCAEAAIAIEGKSMREAFGSPDDLKLRSSATLFSAVSPGSAFERLLEKQYGGVRDPNTVRLLEALVRD